MGGSVTFSRVQIWAMVLVVCAAFGFWIADQKYLQQPSKNTEPGNATKVAAAQFLTRVNQIHLRWIQDPTVRHTRQWQSPEGMLYGLNRAGWPESIAGPTTLSAALSHLNGEAGAPVCTVLAQALLRSTAVGVGTVPCGGDFCATWNPGICVYRSASEPLWGFSYKPAAGNVTILKAAAAP